MGELAKIKSFRTELALVETFEEMKLIGNAAEAYLQLMKKQKVSTDAQNEIAEFIVEVEEKKGEWLDANYPHGGHGSNQYKCAEVSNDDLSKMPATKKESARARAISKAPEEKKEAIKEAIKKQGGVVTVNKICSELIKEERNKQIEEQIEEISKTELRINGKYDVIVIDPPWNYGRKYDPETSRVANPYPEMNFEELSKLEMPAENNAIMWLWSTQAFIWDAKKLMDIWGFDYKAMLIWNKENMGMGYWLRMQCEFCILGIKGKPIWNNTKWRDIITEPRREHSRKPKIFYQMIDEICFGKKADYFGREKRPGWDVFGNDINKFNELAR